MTSCNKLGAADKLSYVEGCVFLFSHAKQKLKKKKKKETKPSLFWFLRIKKKLFQTYDYYGQINFDIFP